ncbi:MAG: STN domain-containing protein, partial [Armatimonadota bacterium]
MEARPTLSFFLLCVLVPALWTGADAAMQEPSKRINLDARDMPLSQVIDTLFKDTGLSYTIDPDIGQLGVTAVLKNVNFETALRNIARAAGVVYRIDGDTYVFASAQPRTSPGPPPGGPPPSDGILEKIPLEFVEPPDIVPVLQMDGTVLVVGSGPSFVVVKGSKDAVEKAKQMVRMLDTPNAYPQAVRIKLVARITVEEKNKAAKTYEASSESVGAAGAPMPLRIQASSGVLPGPRAAAGAAGRHQASAVDATLIPLVDSQAKVSLTGQGVIRGELPIKYEKAFEVAAACSSGQRVVIAAGGAELEDGKVDFEVSVVPTVEKERVKRPM